MVRVCVCVCVCVWVCVCVGWGGGGLFILTSGRKKRQRSIFFCVIILQESGKLVKQVEKSRLWRSFQVPGLMPLLVTVFYSENFILLSKFFDFRSFSILEAITLLKRRNIVRDAYVGL